MFLGLGPVFGQRWAQEPAQRPRLYECYIDQRKLNREIDYKAPKNKNVKYGPESKSGIFVTFAMATVEHGKYLASKGCPIKNIVRPVRG